MLPSNATCLWVVRLISALLVLYSKFFLCFGADFFENCNIWDLKSNIFIAFASPTCTNSSHLTFFKNNKNQSQAASCKQPSLDRYK
ncbi:hypothetical protein GGP41_003207 [Bipolaris sorokiniana]|uniref:Uncharacterized protein n=1 Tax=Cochliobolus sativus TaxID=45130 RepID=A0A8H6DT70_COCSA|nr:hypothetical protein GGP41_003207 [Bipolaris sorokiniana]